MDSAFGIQVLRCEHERELHIIHRLDPLKAHQADNAVRIVENIHILNSVSIFIQAANIVIFHTNEVVGLDAQNIRYRDIALVDTGIRIVCRIDVDIIRHIQVPRHHRHIERGLAVHEVFLRERHGLVLHVLHIDCFIVGFHQRVTGKRLIRIVIDDRDFLNRITALKHQRSDRLIMGQIAEAILPAGPETSLVKPCVRGAVRLRAKFCHMVGIAFWINTGCNTGLG